MYQPSFSSSFQKKKPSMDVARPRASADFASPRYVQPQMTQRSIPMRKGLDGVRSDKRTFLKQLQERTWKDSLTMFFRRSQIYIRRTKRLLVRLIPDLAPRKMVYGSIMGGIAFGMVSMAFIAHFFGPGVFARSGDSVEKVEVATSSADSAEVIDINYDPNQDIFFEYFDEATKEQYEDNIRQMVKGYPIEAMLPYIFEQDRLTAAFLVGIAKKESNWGKRVPVLEGQDCFNYWGYRGVRRMMGSGGHTCFNSRKDAIDTVSKRLNQLIHSQKLDTPEKLIVWKCGFSCEGHSRESVKKWISDVDMYYEQLKDE